MEEYKHENDCFLCRHPALKHVLVGFLVFLGAFAAFYVVSDWHFKRMFDPVYQMKKMDRAMMRDERKFDKMARKEFKRQSEMERNTAQFIRADKTANSYRITIDLRPFDNDEKNIEVKTSGNTLTINAAGEKNDRNKKEFVRYNQTFAFGDDVNMADITKVRQGNEYIISVPFD